MWLIGVLFELYLIPASEVVGTSCYAEEVWSNDVACQIIGYFIIVVQYWIPMVVFVVRYTKMIRTLRHVNITVEFGIVYFEYLRSGVVKNKMYLSNRK